MGRFYAVRVGRVPGIYRNWYECREQTSFFAGAVFKCFDTLSEALTFVSSNDNDLPVSMPRCQELTAYRVRRFGVLGELKNGR